MIIPQFENMTVDELMAFWKKHNVGCRYAAKELLGYRQGYTIIAKDLATLQLQRSVRASVMQ